MVERSEGRSTVPAPMPPDGGEVWDASNVRAQYEPYPGDVATVRERADAAGSQLRYETREPNLGPTGERAIATVAGHFDAE